MPDRAVIGASKTPVPNAAKHQVMWCVRRRGGAADGEHRA
jgi:hypothetical protein